MGIQWQTQVMRDDERRTFCFKGDIQGHIIGISGFQVGYGSNHDHWVKEFSIKLDYMSRPSQTSSVQVHASITLKDDSGNKGPSRYCWAWVTVVVWTGGKYVTSLTTSSSLCDEISKKKIDLPSGSTGVVGASAVINSFGMRYEDSDHHVFKVAARVNAQNSANNSIVTYGSTDMRDSSGHVASCDNLSAGDLAYTLVDPGYEMRIAGLSTGDTDFGHSNNETSVTFSKPVKSATALLVSWEANYDGKDHNVLAILAGAMKFKDMSYYGPPDSISIKNNQVTLTTNVSMFDGSHNQSNINQATFLVIASLDSTSEVKEAALAQAL